MIKDHFRNEDGATAIEYGLIAALIAVAMIAAITTLGYQLENNFNGVENKLEEGNSKFPS